MHSTRGDSDDSDDGGGGCSDNDERVSKATKCIHLGLHQSHATHQGKLGLDFLCK